jgi:hypothetical protein
MLALLVLSERLPAADFSILNPIEVATKHDLRPTEVTEIMLNVHRWHVPLI